MTDGKLLGLRECTFRQHAALPERGCLSKNTILILG